MDLNATMLCAAGAAYDITGTSYSPPTGEMFNDQFTWTSYPIAYVGGTDNDDACFVGQCATGIIVAARGTIFLGSENSADYLADWLVDFDFPPVAWANPVTNQALTGKVHQGFYQAVQNVWPGVFAQVQALYNASPDKASPTPVYVTGHSKGGGMAPLLAYLLQLNGIPVAQVVTFAAPRPGDSGFQALYNQAFAGKHTRFENYGDLVPLVWPSPDVATPILKLLQSLLPKWPILAGLIAAIEKAENWDYQPVGAESFINWLPKLGQSIITDSFFIDILQGPAFIFNLGAQLVEGRSLGDILMVAHTITSCYNSVPVVGYLSEVCPSLIPQSCATVTPPPTLAFK